MVGELQRKLIIDGYRISENGEGGGILVTVNY